MLRSRCTLTAVGGSSNSYIATRQHVCTTATHAGRPRRNGFTCVKNPQASPMLRKQQSKSAVAKPHTYALQNDITRTRRNVNASQAPSSRKHKWQAGGARHSWY
jgi:hypothetical protein